jgi:hypothetical protein
MVAKLRQSSAFILGTLDRVNPTGDLALFLPPRPTTLRTGYVTIRLAAKFSQVGRDHKISSNVS